MYAEVKKKTENKVPTVEGIYYTTQDRKNQQTAELFANFVG
jgi:hypothetical protein